jgi:hypothetical protein
VLVVVFSPVIPSGFSGMMRGPDKQLPGRVRNAGAEEKDGR